MGLADIRASLDANWQKSPIRPVIQKFNAWVYFLFKKTKSVTWIFGVTLVVVGFPLILQIEREQQIIEMEKQQMQPGYGQAPQLGMTPLQR